MKFQHQFWNKVENKLIKLFLKKNIKQNGLFMSNKYKIVLLITIAILSILQISCNKSNIVRDSGSTRWIVTDDTLIDPDGNIYTTIQIGNKVWTKENLCVTVYNNGKQIPNARENFQWTNCNSGAYCYYNNESSVNAKKYGALYNWHAVNTRKLSPDGWHVPTDDDWTVLEEYLIANGYNWDGTTTGNKIGKSMAAKSDWHTSYGQGNIGNNLSQNNASNFSALPGGNRDYNGDFNSKTITGGWWSATENTDTSAYHRSLGYGRNHLYIGYNYNKRYGFSIRLVKD